MEDKCDVCGITEGVQCEVFTKGEVIDRVYHLCPEHWTEVYRRTLDDFVESNEYKVHSYIKMSADKLIADATTSRKLLDYEDEDGNLDSEQIKAIEIRSIQPYSGGDDD